MDEIIELFIDEKFIQNKLIINKLLTITFGYLPTPVPSSHLPDPLSFQNSSQFVQGSNLIIKILDRVYSPPAPNSDFVPNEGGTGSASPKRSSGSSSSSSGDSLSSSMLPSFFNDKISTSSGSVLVKSGEDDFNKDPLLDSPYLVQSLTSYFPLFNLILESALVRFSPLPFFPIPLFSL